jgi:DNA polymerase III epsilon subunit-like protein
MNPSTWPAKVFIVDVEGNGANPPDLVEVAAVPVTGAAPGPARQWLIQPPAPIQPRVTRIHGITNADVADAPLWEQVADDIRATLAGAWIVAHNATVEYGCLTRHLPDWQPAGVIDTLRAARTAYKDAPGYGLDALIRHTRIDVSRIPGQRHRAAYDATATALLLLDLAEHYSTWDAMAATATPPGLPGAPATTEEATLW